MTCVSTSANEPKDMLMKLRNSFFEFPAAPSLRGVAYELIRFASIHFNRLPLDLFKERSNHLASSFLSILSEATNLQGRSLEVDLTYPEL